ncbi:TetR/AcrR family transcriptional regulator [Sphingomonas panni]|uniref:TetR/AcrR family transcriptional regulator n=1 Tax=Sphingomonas panni TaxID=237612 RepID=UPI001F5B6623
MGRIRTIERDKLLDAAEAVTMDKGPAGLTIAAVAERMGITNGGVQYSFRSKESLIAAMFERWQQEYADHMMELGASPDDGASRIRAHLSYSTSYEERSKRGAPTLLVSLLNSPQHMVQVRRWYRNRLDAIDTSIPEGRWLRLAFLSLEGAFLMRLFGLIDMESDEWRSIVDDVWALCDGTLVRAQDDAGRQAA